MAALLLGGDAGAQTAQVTTAVDGDTIKLNGHNVRLWGIDAPEMKQDCDGQLIGVQATRTLDQLMRGRTVACERKTQDRYGRQVVLCLANGDDLGAAMVRAGMAWAFARYSRDYVQLEEQARSQGLGVHAHGCIPAWEWRAQRR